MSELSPVSRSNLRQGAIYMLVGLLWGMVIPASPFPRLALGRTHSTHGTRRHVLGCRSCHSASPVCEGRRVRKNTHRRSVADMAGDADGNGEWLVGRSENAPYRSRTSWGNGCGTVARNHRYGRPSDWGCRLDCLLGSNCGRSVPQADQRGIGYEPTDRLNASRNVSGGCAGQRDLVVDDEERHAVHPELPCLFASFLDRIHSLIAV